MKADPWGILGGGNGARGGIWVKRAGEQEWQTFVEAFGTLSPSKFSGIRLQPGDQVRLAMPGGGGYGDPLKRDRAMVERDIAEGFVTAERALADYGYMEDGEREAGGGRTADEPSRVTLSGRSR